MLNQMLTVVVVAVVGLIALSLAIKANRANAREPEPPARDGDTVPIRR